MCNRVKEEIEIIMFNLYLKKEEVKHRAKRINKLKKNKLCLK